MGSIVFVVFDISTVWLNAQKNIAKVVQNFIKKSIKVFVNAPIYITSKET